MELKVADQEDIDNTLDLHYKYQVDSIAAEDKEDGFVTTPFERQQLVDLVQQESGLFIAVDNKKVVGYAMAASWHFWAVWPMYAHMIKELPDVIYKGVALNVDNSYQYGPICIDRAMRGTGLVNDLFFFAAKEMAKKYQMLVTFINKINQRSYHAHTRKLGLEVIREFEYNNNQYYELVLDVSQLT